MIWHSTVVGTRAIALTVTKAADPAHHVARVTSQPLNPRTGTPWQDPRVLGHAMTASTTFFNALG
jgi:hypothetical protein